MLEPGKTRNATAGGGTSGWAAPRASPGHKFRVPEAFVYKKTRFGQIQDTVWANPGHGLGKSRTRFGQIQDTVWANPGHGLGKSRTRFGQIQDTVWANPGHGLGKSRTRFGQIQDTVWANPGHGLGKSRTRFGQIRVTVWANPRDGRGFYNPSALVHTVGWRVKLGRHPVLLLQGYPFPDLRWFLLSVGPPLTGRVSLCWVKPEVRESN